MTRAYMNDWDALPVAYDVCTAVEISSGCMCRIIDMKGAYAVDRDRCPDHSRLSALHLYTLKGTKLVHLKRRKRHRCRGCGAHITGYEYQYLMNRQWQGTHYKPVVEYYPIYIHSCGCEWQYKPHTGRWARVYDGKV